MDAVHRYEGTVNQVLGDGIMALFGAPLAHEDHALRACYAALAMQEEMRRHREKLGQSEEAGLQIGIGMNSGEVVVRSIDNDLNIEYSALGHTTHLAAQDAGACRCAGAIIMTATTLRQVEGFVKSNRSARCKSKVFRGPLRPTSSSVPRRRGLACRPRPARGLTPLVGRQSEIEVFNKLVEQAASGEGPDFGDGWRAGHGEIAFGPRIYSTPVAPGLASVGGRIGFLRQGNSLFSA